MTTPIHTWEKQHARLNTLADSINDSARMARGSLSLLLLVALYSGLILVVSTDENLLVNGQVALPQTGVGISIVHSYIFAPPIFLYLHIQTLYLLSMLARKVRTFETILTSEFPKATTQDEQNKVKAEREEHWEWLSAFAFIQLFRRDNVSLVPTVLIWLGTTVIPLLLLLAIDLSFVRYQSLKITVSHHIFLLLDLLFVILFVRRTLNPNLVSMPKLAMDMAKVVWTFGIMFMIILILNAFPPHFELRTVEEDKRRIWRKTESSHSELKNIENLLDSWLCELGRACRYLDVSGKRLVKTRPQDLDYVNNLDLSERNLRFAKLSYTRLQNADLSGAKLQGADLASSDLQGADLSGAWLQGANLMFAKLQGAKLWKSRLHGVSLYRAKLQGAKLWYAQLQGVSFSSAQMQGVELNNAWLQGVTFLTAQLQGADLSNAQLQGADLFGAQLQGANLFEAKLQGANLSKAQLQGADLSKAQLQSSVGTPRIPQDGPILMYQTSFKWNKESSRRKYLDKLLTDMSADIELADIKPAWGKHMTLEDHLRERILNKQMSPNPDDWTYNINLNYDKYSEKWVKWTSDFACGNEYTARSSLQRWESYFYPPRRERTMKFGTRNFPVYPIQTIFNAMVDARKNREDCPGLRAIPDDEWEDFRIYKFF